MKGRGRRPSKYIIIITLTVSYEGLRGTEKSEDSWWPHHGAQLLLWTLLEFSVVIRMMVVVRRAFRYGKNTGQASLTSLTKLTKGTGPNNNIQEICYSGLLSSYNSWALFTCQFPLDAEFLERPVFALFISVASGIRIPGLGTKSCLLPVCVNKALGTQPHTFVHMFALALQCQGWGPDTETLQLMNSKISGSLRKFTSPWSSIMQRTYKYLFNA